MKRLSFKLRKVPVDWITVVLLFLANSYKLYPGMIAVLWIMAFQVLRRRKVYLFREWKAMVWCWAIIGATMFFSFLIYYSSVNNLFWGMFTYTPILIYPFLMSRHIEEHAFLNALKVFVLLQIPFFVFQYAEAVVQLGTINIFSANSGAGDTLEGSAMGFSSNIAVTLSVVALLFLFPYREVSFRGRIPYFLLAFFLMILPGYMSAVLLLFAAAGIYYAVSTIRYVISMRIPKLVAGSIGILTVGAIVITVMEFSNIVYVAHMIGIVTKNVEFVKIRSIMTTVGDFTDELGPGIVAGVGAGNYSSRGAFITGGDYLERQPAFIPVTPSYFHQKYMKPLMDLRASSEWIGGSHKGSVVNTPFCQFQTVYGEGGLISLGLLFAIMLLSLRKVKGSGMAPLSIGLMFWIFLMLLDNWLAYPTYCLSFWLLLRASMFGTDARTRKVARKDGRVPVSAV